MAANNNKEKDAANKGINLWSEKDFCSSQLSFAGQEYKLNIAAPKNKESELGLNNTAGIRCIRMERKVTGS